MDFRILNYFLLVAREENITKAAQLLHVSQPTLSRQLMQLEEELGVKLFHRGKHNVYLTNEGMLFRRRAQEIVQLAERARGELRETEEVLTGTIAVGCGEFLAMDELATIMTAFNEQYPFVQFELHSAFNQDIKELIEQGSLDLGLLIEPVDIAKYDFIRMKKREEYGVLVRQDSELARRKVIHPEDLAGVSLIMVNDSLTQHELTGWLGDYAEKVEMIASYNLLYNAAALVRRRGGAAFCLRLGADYKGTCFIPFEPQMELHTVLAWKDQQSFSRATSTFIRFIKECKI